MKKSYLAPIIIPVSVATETLLAESEKLQVAGKDTDATTGTNGYTWGEVKRNTVDWDEAQ